MNGPILFVRAVTNSEIEITLKGRKVRLSVEHAKMFAEALDRQIRIASGV